MSESISRAWVSDIEIRSDGTGRTVSGIVVPFGQVARVSDGGPSYDEAFQAGAFKQTLNQMGGNYGRVKLLSQHSSRTNPLGRATSLREDASGLFGEFHVSKTRAGEEALELLRDGALDSFSVGFTPIKHVKRDRVTWRTEVGLREASIVTFPAYAGATVQGIRAWDDLSDEDRDEAIRLLQQAIDLRSTTPDGETETLGTSREGAPSDEAAGMPLRSVTQKRLAYRLALIERGIRNEQEN